MYCSQCGTENTAASSYCVSCGAALQSDVAPPVGQEPIQGDVRPQVSSRTNALAVIALVLSIVGFLVPLVTQIAAIICGHIARSQIRTRQGQQTGYGMALAALIVSYIMIVLIALLAMIAIPQYSAYTARAQASEALSLAGPPKTAVSEYRMNEGVWPRSNAEANIRMPNFYRGKYVSSVSVGDGGRITIVMKSTGVASRLAGRKIILTPTDGGGYISWVCSNDLDNSEQNLVPSVCKN